VTDAFRFPRSVLVLGGASDIAYAILHRLADRGLERAVLAARNVEALRDRLSREPLPIASVHVVEWDARDTDADDALLRDARDRVSDIDLVLCAVGSLGHAAGLSAAIHTAADMFTDNLTGPAAAITAAAHHLAEQGHGTIVVLSSVAALRTRRSNYLYGASKAGLDAFAQGLSDALVGTSVHVHIVRPGFVKTKMTEGLPPAPFSTTAEAVADAVVGLVTSDRSRIVHVPSVLGPMFGILRLLPRPLWRRIAGDR
jgi:decaprenylphospho-beta-D-erythro-pentofuranosid-2-ulose 2-reductase